MLEICHLFTSPEVFFVWEPQLCNGRKKNYVFSFMNLFVIFFFEVVGAKYMYFEPQILYFCIYSFMFYMQKYG